MSHLREQISAFVDGELTGSDLDRASGHLAACGQCRAEAAALRQLKRELHALAASEPFGMARDEAGHAAVPADEALTRRLLAMAGPGGPVPSRRSRREQYRRRRREHRNGRPPTARAGMAGRA